MSKEELQNLYDARAADKDLSLSWSIYRDVRSLTANGYFHKLVGLLADAQDPPVSKIRCKNIMLARYGQREYLPTGELMVIKTNIPTDVALEWEYMHLLPFRFDAEKGNEVVWYAAIRGSHTYNSKEMATLINGTVQECKDQGVETLPPEELERLINMWVPRKRE